MAKVLLLGAGLVSRPLTRYLLDKGFKLTIASRTVSKAQALLEGHPGGTARAWVVEDLDGLSKLVADHDLAISLLPATMHPKVAEMCIEHRKHMVTTSYVSPVMRAMDGKAKSAGITLLNELGVDPGIDHMSAMQIVHAVEKKGGKITTFRSYCGGLPAPDANNNPWGYKFSWSPQGVLLAGKNSARYLKNGKVVEIEPKYLFADTHPMIVAGVGELESYPNRDSMGYVDLYGLKDATTMFRGTLRYKGWCDTLRRVGEIGLLDDKQMTGLSGKTWAQIMAGLIGADTTQGIQSKVAAHLWLPPESDTMKKFEWLGLFSEKKVSRDKASVLELLSDVMTEQMAYAPRERDMIVMHHEFVASYGAKAERITATMVDYGIPGGDSSMARTVSLPAAIATRMILEGKITERGVLIPVQPHIYNPVLAELQTMKIGLTEKTTAL